MAGAHRDVLDDRLCPGSISIRGPKAGTIREHPRGEKKKKKPSDRRTLMTLSTIGAWSCFRNNLAKSVSSPEKARRRFDSVTGHHILNKKDVHQPGTAGISRLRAANSKTDWPCSRV